MSQHFIDGHHAPFARSIRREFIQLGQYFFFCLQASVYYSCYTVLISMQYKEIHF